MESNNQYLSVVRLMVVHKVVLISVKLKWCPKLNFSLRFNYFKNLQLTL